MNGMCCSRCRRPIRGSNDHPGGESPICPKCSALDRLTVAEFLSGTDPRAFTVGQFKKAYRHAKRILRRAPAAEKPAIEAAVAADDNASGVTKPTRQYRPPRPLTYEGVPLDPAMRRILKRPRGQA